MTEQIGSPGQQRAEETYQQGYDAQNNDTWDRDLNPDGFPGRNRGNEAAQPGATRTAFDVKEAHQRLSGMSDDDLRQVPIVNTGTRLEQGATYIDLLGDRSEFSAMGNMSAGDGNAYVAKNDVDYQLWNRLIGVENPERVGDADDA